MVLRFDPDDDDAEAREIDDIAQQHVDQIGAGLSAQLESVAAAGTSTEVLQLLDTLPTQPLQGAVEALLQASAGRGVRMAADTLDRVMMGVNWRLPNEAAMAWARSYSYELVHGITETSRRLIADALGDWVRDGGSMNDLIAQLSPQFGPVRAELIAITESTRAYGVGSRMQYRSAGIRKVKLLTNRDDRVCDVCRPYDEMVVDIDQGVPGVGFPPWHPACRCYCAGIVE